MKTANTSSPRAGRETPIPAAAREVAEQVGREILESRLEPGAWATALAECRGRRQEALAAYTRIRIQQLTKLHRLQRVKNRSFESRRIAKCMGDNETRESIARTVQELLQNSTPRSGTLNFLKPKLSALWLTLLFIGTAGTVASFSRLFLAKFPLEILQSPALIAVAAGTATVSGALMLRYFLPKRWIMLGWNSGLVVACNVMCLSSLFLGTKLIKHAIATDTAALPILQKAKPAPQKAIVVKPKLPVEKRYLVSAQTAQESLEN